jgi:hypothetical protein
VKFEEVAGLLAALERRGVRYVLIGGMAMAALGIARATQDIDLFVEPKPDNVARLRQALRDAYDDDAIDEISDEDLAGQYPVIRYGPPDGGFVIDLVGRLGEAYTFADVAFEKLEIDGIMVPVATARVLFEMKRDTLRPQDRADAEALRRRFNLED